MQIVGILNITPDSFSDGGLYYDSQKAIAHLYTLLEEGADLIDIGAESTRPGAIFIDQTTEWQRLEPVLQEIKKQNLKITLSIDTRKAYIAKRSLDYLDSVQIINDVSSLEDPEMLVLLKENPDLKIVLNHHRGLPVIQQNQITNWQIMQEIISFFRQKLGEESELKTLRLSQIILDPGFGFGKNTQENLLILQNLDLLRETFDLPLFLGLSRKRFVRELWGEQNQEIGSLGLIAFALAKIPNLPEKSLYIRCHEPGLYKPLKKLFIVCSKL